VRFFFHYNKPASQKAGAPRITVHLQKQCHLVENLDVHVPTHGRVRKTQPFFVMAGECNEWEIDGNVMVLR
jgi:hypothetical protein